MYPDNLWDSCPDCTVNRCPEQDRQGSGSAVGTNATRGPRCRAAAVPVRGWAFAEGDAERDAVVGETPLLDIGAQETELLILRPVVAVGGHEGVLRRTAALPRS